MIYFLLLNYLLKEFKMDYKLSRLISKVTVVSSLLIIFIFGSAWIFKELIDYKNSIDNLKLEYIQKNEELISTEVNNVISLINYNYSLKMKRVKKLVKQRVNEAHDLMKKIYEENKSTKTKEEITELIKESLRNIRFFEGTGYYFIYSLDGKNILHPLKPEVENTYKFKNFKDLSGKEILKDWQKILQTKNEGYSTWTFYRVDDTTKQDLKVGYFKLFEPYNFILGTADYLYRVENELKKETLERIRHITHGENSYFFVVSKDGKVLVSRTYKNLEGKHYSIEKNQHLSKVIRKVLLNSNKDGSFITYNWQFEDSKIYQKKLSYIKEYEKWGWIIGTGVFFDEINKKIELKKEQLKKDIFIQVMLVIFISIIVMLFSFILNRYLRNKIKKSLDIFLNFFKVINEKNEKIDLDKVDFYEFTKIAIYANKMIDIKIRNENEITKKDKELKQSIVFLEEYKKAVDEAAIVSKTDNKGIITYVNDEFCKISGYSKDELLGQNHSILKHEDMDDKLFKDLWSKITNKEVWKGIIKNKAKDGSAYYVKSTIVPILDVDSKIKEYIAIRYDITDLVNYELKESKSL